MQSACVVSELWRMSDGGGPEEGRERGSYMVGGEWQLPPVGRAAAAVYITTTLRRQMRLSEDSEGRPNFAR